MGKHGFVTVRDVLKWGKRIYQNYDPSSSEYEYAIQDLMKEGYMLLAEKLRSSEEKVAVQELLMKMCKVYEYNWNNLYTSIDATTTLATTTTTLASTAPSHKPSAPMTINKYYNSLQQLNSRLKLGQVHIEGIHEIAVTESLSRLWSLVGRCVDYSEPALLIGETGCGKLLVCLLCLVDLTEFLSHILTILHTCCR